MDEGLVRVHVLGLPLDLAARAEEHAEGLTREMVLLSMELEQDPEASDLPARLVGLVQAFSASYGSFGVHQQKQIEAAAAAGESSIDLVYEVPAAIAEATERIRDMQEEVDEYCRRGGYLLTLEMPPDVLAYRHWLFEEFIGQARGRPPTRWSPWTGSDEPDERVGTPAAR